MADTLEDISEVITALEQMRRPISCLAMAYVRITPEDLLARGWRKHPAADIYLPPKIKEYVA